jgi:uncharacterized membrane protein HdeD (DUF308 family)
MAQQSTSPSSPADLAQVTIAEDRTWFMILGLALIVLGIVAVAFPFLTTVAVKIFLGWLFLISGIVQIFHAFSTQKWSAFFFNLLVGALYLVAGAWLAFLPLTGIITLTVLLAAMFIIQGLLEAGMAMRLRPHAGWTWMLIAGLVALTVGALIFAELPSSAVWAIGLLVGVKMITSGWAYFFLALAAGKKA